VYEQGQDIPIEMFWDLGKNGTTFVHNTYPGNYYLRIFAANINRWNVTIETWKPEK